MRSRGKSVSTSFSREASFSESSFVQGGVIAADKSPADLLQSMANAWIAGGSPGERTSPLQARD